MRSLGSTLIGLLVIAVLVLAGMTAGPASPAAAADATHFNPGNIISDDNFYNSGAMSEAEIQSFLESRVPSCAAGFTCLRDYVTNTGDRSTVAQRCNGYSASPTERASTIIFKVSQSCGINPQVLIVLLQKEQGLVTSTAPSSGRYRIATGYGCPDSAACDSTYYGFFNQVYQAAYQFKLYRQYASSYNIKPFQNNNILWSPTAGCGSSTVYVENQATAGLYNYTPYQPNGAALANLYGTGDGCSSYGNRNFWAYFSDWFGSPTTDSHAPFGSLDELSGGIGVVRIRGWAIDPDTADPVTVPVYVDGVGIGGFTASSPRDDVAAANPSFGANHGFDLTVPLTSGTHTVCVYGVNIGRGYTNPLYGCRAVTVTDPSPVGSLDASTAPGRQISVSGWAIDPETTGPIPVHVYLDGAFATDTTAASPAALPSGYASTYGSDHGYSATLTTSPGAHTVCAYGINTGLGTNRLIGCSTVTAIGGAAFGSFDSVSPGLGSTTVSGWAIDPDTTRPIDVHVYVDGRLATQVSADRTRNDVAAVFPTYGAVHGFAAKVSLGSGSHTICVYGIDASGGDPNALIGCKTATAPSPSPIGSLDEATPQLVRGWAIDPDTSAPIEVRFYVDGAYAASTIAAGARGDIANAYPDFGAAHGYSMALSMSPGVHQVCAYGINTGPGSNAAVGCRSVTVP